MKLNNYHNCIKFLNFNYNPYIKTILMKKTIPSSQKKLGASKKSLNPRLYQLNSPECRIYSDQPKERDFYGKSSFNQSNQEHLALNYSSKYAAEQATNKNQSGSYFYHPKKFYLYRKNNSKHLIPKNIDCKPIRRWSESKTKQSLSLNSRSNNHNKTKISVNSPKNKYLNSPNRLDHAAIQQINDQDIYKMLCNKYRFAGEDCYVKQNTSIKNSRQRSIQDENSNISPENCQKLAQIINDHCTAKNNQIEALSILKDQLKLINLLRQYKLIERDDMMEQQRLQNPESKRFKICVSTLRNKNKISLKMKKKQIDMEKMINEQQKQSNLLSQYLISITETEQQRMMSNSNDLKLNLKTQSEIMNRNLQNQVECIKKQLQITKNRNLRAIKKVQKDIIALRVQIKNKQQALKSLNNQIFASYIRKNKKLQSRIQLQIHRLLISPNQQLEHDESMIENVENSIMDKTPKASSVAESSIKKNRQVMKSLLFSNDSNHLSFQCIYQGENKKVKKGQQYLLAPLKHKFQEKQIIINQKLKSLTFYFVVKQHETIFKGLVAKYCILTHSYDIGRESEIIKIGEYDQKYAKLEFSCKNKEIITIGHLINKKNDQFCGFTLYYRKKSINTKLDMQQNIYLPRLRTSMSRRRSSRSSSSSKYERLSIQINKDEKQLKQDKFLNKKIDKNRKNVEANIEYCLN